MQYRRLGSTGIRVSAISLGGWATFGDAVRDQGAAAEIIHAAYDGGINFFDMADFYALGRAENIMGRVLQDFPRHTLVLSSKVFWPMSDDVNDRGLSRKHIMESVDKSLKRINTDYLDLYFCHRFDPETPLEEVIRAMDDLVHRGKVLYWGTSKWSAAQITDAAQTASAHNLYPLRVEQPPYNLLRREMESDVLAAVRTHGIGLTTYSPLHNGILTGKYDQGVPENTRIARDENLRKGLTAEVVRRVKALKPLADELGLTRAQLALAWILRLPEVSSVITGATRPDQVRANMTAADVTLDDDVIRRIEKTTG